MEARRGEWLGSVVIAIPMSRWLMTTLIASMALAIVLFLILGRYTRRETVTGQLVPNAGLLNVASPVAGTVIRLAVRDGQEVRQGQRCLNFPANRTVWP